MRNHNRRKKYKVTGPRKDNHPRGNNSPHFSRHRHCPAKGKNKGGGHKLDLYDDYNFSKTKARIAAAEAKAERAIVAQQAELAKGLRAETERKREREATIAQKLAAGYTRCRYHGCDGVVSRSGTYCDRSGHYSPSNLSSW